MRKRSFLRRNALLGNMPLLGPAALALVALVAVAGGLRAFFPDALTRAASPFWNAGSGLSAAAADAGAYLAGPATLRRERDAARAEAAALAAKQATLAGRVADLQALLGTRTEPIPGIVAGVLARPPVSPYDALVVDQGTEAGVAAGSAVFGAGGMPVGTVESVTARSARVSLYSTPARETEGWVGDARIPVTLVGGGSGALNAEAARDAGIKEGDLVFVPGPGAVALGVVTAVGSDPSAPRAPLSIRPFANPFSMTWVTIAP